MGVLARHPSAPPPTHLLFLISSRLIFGNFNCLAQKCGLPNTVPTTKSSSFCHWFCAPARFRVNSFSSSLYIPFIKLLKTTSPITTHHPLGESILVLSFNRGTRLQHDNIRIYQCSISCPSRVIILPCEFLLPSSAQTALNTLGIMSNPTPP